MCREGPRLFPELGEVVPPGERPSHTGGGSSLWGSDRIPCDPARPSGAGAPRAGAGATTGQPAATSAWKGRGGASSRGASGRGRAGLDAGYGGNRLVAPPRVPPFRWNSELRLEVGGTMSPQLLFGMRASFEEDLSAEFTFCHPVSIDYGVIPGLYRLGQRHGWRVSGCLSSPTSGRFSGPVGGESHDAYAS